MASSAFNLSTRIIDNNANTFSMQLQVLTVRSMAATWQNSDLWIDPKNGTLCLGPRIQIPFYEGWTMLGYTSNLTPNGHLPPLSIQTYKDMDTTFDYLTRSIPTFNIVGGIAGCNGRFWEQMTDEDAGSILQNFPNTIYHRHSQKVIARLPVKVRDRSYYYLYRTDVSSHAMSKSLVVMRNGLVQYIFMPLDIQYVKEIILRYLLSSDGILAYSWITQAHSVFTQLRIDEDKWEEYCAHGRLDLIFKCRIQHSLPQENISTTSIWSGGPPVYLFVQPIPQPLDNNEIWRSWAKSAKYFWSFDPFGKEEMSEATQLLLGLPSFTSEIDACHQYWDQSVYSAIRMLHHHHNFDPPMTDLAGLVGLPVLEVVGDEDRFEACKDSIEITPTSDSRESDGPTLKNCWNEADDSVQSRSSEEEDSLVLAELVEENEVAAELMCVDEESDMEVDEFLQVD
ncbi:hypothetical protein Moror_2294 [Moniliophthora roreri MCA 2997]|uniref:Uncharacterized protein n=1 Tax=Moniliophthora roreri (strain MCA 2997) TaxID=1381753 RepID=V2WGC8_MONRO|nr:hypothetical protein Moror_2294 [Moniliophthora roreri MCA 2997]